jgi:tetratricopeptide (TPR) repeat protein
MIGSTIKSRQYILFAGILCVTALLSTAGYHIVHQDRVLFRKAETLFHSRDYAQAASQYKLALEAGLKNPDAFSRMGDAYLASGAFKDAARAFEEVLRKRPGYQYAVRRLASVYDYSDRTDEAVALYLHHSASTSKDSVALVHLGDLYKRKKEYQEAERVYQRALEIRPDLLSARIGLAELYTWMGRYEKAASLYRAVLKEQPTLRSARVQLARVLSWKGDLDEAIKEYRIVLGE